MGRKWVKPVFVFTIQIENKGRKEPERLRETGAFKLPGLRAAILGSFKPNVYETDGLLYRRFCDLAFKHDNPDNPGTDFAHSNGLFVSTNLHARSVRRRLPAG